MYGISNKISKSIKLEVIWQQNTYFLAQRSGQPSPIPWTSKVTGGFTTMPFNQQFLES